MRGGLPLLAALIAALPRKIGAQRAPRAADRLRIVTLDGLRWQQAFGRAQRPLISGNAGGVADAAGLHHLRTRKTRVLYVMLGDTDGWAHQHRYDLCLDAAYRGRTPCSWPRIRGEEAGTSPPVIRPGRRSGRS